MKLNFWQWLGILFLIAGAVGYVWLKDSDKKPTRVAPPTTQVVPATVEAH